MKRKNTRSSGKTLGVAPLPWLEKMGLKTESKSWDSITAVQTPATIDPNEIFPCFYIKKWPRRILLLHKLKGDSGSAFS